MLKVYYKWSVQIRITQFVVLQSDLKRTSDCKKKGERAPPVPPPLESASGFASTFKLWKPKWETQVAQEQRKATEECEQKIILIQEQRKLSQLNKASFPQFLQQT